ncbi:MAG: hypothetical protein K2L34_02520 [Muribaculaceae bacterium]|nr:hypothetical protein [Muribaculaceae bacterium]
MSELRRFHHPRVPDLMDSLKGNKRLLLRADSYGSGLSAIAANEIPDDVTFIDKEGKRHQPRVIRSFINPDVNSMEILKRMFINSLHKAYGEVNVSEIYRPVDEQIDFKGIVNRFPKEEYLWIVDSPENFSDTHNRSLTELLKKTDFLDYIVIVSSDSKIRDICSNHKVFIKTIEKPTEKDLVAITTNYLRHYGKSLSERQNSAIIGSGILTNIKMLVVFLDILRNFGVYEDVDKFIHSFVSLNSEKEFYNRYFEYLENEFSETVVAETFRRLQVLDMGISEKGLFSGVLNSRIEQSSYMSAIENLLSRRFHNYMLPINSMVAEVVAERYPLGKVDFKRISNLLVRDYRRRMKEIESDKPKSVVDRIGRMYEQLLMRGYRLIDDNGLSAELGMLHSTVMVLLIRNGYEKKAIRMMRHYGIMSLFMFRPKDIPYVIDLFRKGQYKPYNMISTFDILTSRYLLGDYVLLYVWNKLNTNEAEESIFQKKIMKKLLPKRLKREILEIIKGGDNASMFIDLWDENFDFENEEMKSRKYLALLNQAPLILHYGNKDYVHQIFEKLERTYSKMDDANPIKLIFLRAALFCSIRLNDKRKYDMLITEIYESPLSKNIENDLIFTDIIVNLIKDRKSTSYPASFIDTVNGYIELMDSVSNYDGTFTIQMSKAIVLYYRSREKEMCETKEEVISFIENKGWIIDTFYFNSRKDIAAYFLPVFLEQDLSVEDRVFYGRMYADSLKEIGNHNEAIEEYRKALATAEANNLTSGAATVQSILCEVLKYYVLKNDLEGFEHYARRFIGYGESGKYECDKATVYNQVSNGYILISDHIENKEDVERARNKAIGYSLRAYKEEPTNWILWSNYVGYLRDFQQINSIRNEDLKILIKEGKRLMVANSVSDSTFLENLGKLYIAAGMDEDLEELMRKYPNVTYKNTAMENYARLLEIETDTDKRKEYLTSMMANIEIYVFRHITKKQLVPLDFILSTIKQSGEGEKIAHLFYEDSVLANGELHVYEMMLAANIFRSFGEKERGDLIEKEVVMYLLEGKGMFKQDDYVAYGLFQSDCPYTDYTQIRKYIMDRYISKDIEEQEIYELGIFALYDPEKTQEYVEMASEKGRDFNKLIEEEARLFIKYDSESFAEAFVKFCESVNAEMKKGREVTRKTIQSISEATERRIESMLAEGMVLYLEGWQEVEELLRRGNVVLGKNMVINGLHVTESDRQDKLYEEYYQKERDVKDYSVAFVYLYFLYERGNMELYEKILADMEAKITPEDKDWPTLQVELAINYRSRGEYSEAMKAFKQLSDYCDKNNKVFSDYIYILFPLITSLLDNNYEEYHVQSDRVKTLGVEQNLIDILNCTYYLKVDNFITAERLYNLVRPKWDNCYIDTGEEIHTQRGDNGNEGSLEFGENEEMLREGEESDDTNQSREVIVALTAYRFIELSRYHWRHKEDEKAKDAYLIAERLLEELEGKHLYFHNELKRLRTEIVVNE